MSSGFSGDYFPFAGRYRRLYNPRLPELVPDPVSNILQGEFPGKRSLAEFQAQHRHNQALSFYLRNVKARTLGFPTQNSEITPGIFSPFGYPNLDPNLVIKHENEKIMDTLRGVEKRNAEITPGSASFVSAPNRVVNDKLQELEKQLLDDDDDDSDKISVITNSEWSDTLQRLIGPAGHSLSPTSSCSSSCSSAPPALSPKQSLIEAATAISENKIELAREMLTRQNPGACVTGTAEQRLAAYLANALRSRVGLDNAPEVPELYGGDTAVSAQMLYEVSPCFKLGFMAANLAILEATSDRADTKLHVIDFDIGRGGHYVHLIHALAARRGSSLLKITAVTEFGNDAIERLKGVGDGLRALATRVGLSFGFNALSLKVGDLSPENLGVEKEEKLAVNLSFKLYKLPDESVSTENLRDEMLRRVKGLSPTVVAVVEQDMNANTAPFLARVNEACAYYGALFESLDSTMPRDNLDRVRIEEWLGLRLANSVAFEGRERVERCEVFGKWRARMGMAGFKPRPMARPITESLMARLSSGAGGNPGFTVEEENGGISFGWMGRKLTVASAWQ